MSRGIWQGISGVCIIIIIVLSILLGSRPREIEVEVIRTDTLEIIKKDVKIKWKTKTIKEIQYINTAADTVQPRIRAELRARYRNRREYTSAHETIQGRQHNDQYLNE